MVLQTYIARLATRLDFACDVKRYPVFDMINTLLNVDVDYEISSIRQRAVIKLQAWIRTTFIFPSEEHNKIVANFYAKVSWSDEEMSVFQKKHISFFSALGNRKISNMMASSKDLASILNRVPQEERETLLLAIRLAHIGGEIKDGFDLSLALGGLSIERYADNLAKLENEKFCEIMMKKDGLQKLLNFLSEEQCVAFILALDTKKLNAITW